MQAKNAEIYAYIHAKMYTYVIAQTETWGDLWTKSLFAETDFGLKQ